MPVPRKRTLSFHRIVGPPASRPIVPTAAPPIGAPGLVAGLITASPAPGRFYLVGSRPGDSLSTVVRDALDAYQGGLGSSGTSRHAYMQCVSAGRRWNLRLYGSAHTSPEYPETLLLDGLGVARAFDPWNADAVCALRAGSWPMRAIDEEGDRVGGVGSELGLLWLPLIHGWQAQGRLWIPVCGEYDPPAVLLDALHSPAAGRSR